MHPSTFDITGTQHWDPLKLGNKQTINEKTINEKTINEKTINGHTFGSIATTKGTVKSTLLKVGICAAAALIITGTVFASLAIMGASIGAIPFTASLSLFVSVPLVVGITGVASLALGFLLNSALDSKEKVDLLITSEDFFNNNDENLRTKGIADTTKLLRADEKTAQKTTESQFIREVDGGLTKTYLTVQRNNEPNDGRTRLNSSNFEEKMKQSFSKQAMFNIQRLSIIAALALDENVLEQLGSQNKGRLSQELARDAHSIEIDTDENSTTITIFRPFNMRQTMPPPYDEGVSGHGGYVQITTISNNDLNKDFQLAETPDPQIDFTYHYLPLETFSTPINFVVLDAEHNWEMIYKPANKQDKDPKLTEEEKISIEINNRAIRSVQENYRQYIEKRKGGSDQPL
jgi:hypothetical protein